MLTKTKAYEKVTYSLNINRHLYDALCTGGYGKAPDIH